LLAPVIELNAGSAIMVASFATLRWITAMVFEFELIVFHRGKHWGGLTVGVVQFRMPNRILKLF